MYHHEMTDEDHERFLSVVLGLPAMVMISGYRCELYNEALAGWQAIDYPAQTRGGIKTETLWINFNEPVRLHDYQYLGADFRERERIKRKVERWKNRLEKLDRLEKQALLQALSGIDDLA